MRKQLIAILALCAAGLAWSAQGQNTGSSTSSSGTGASTEPGQSTSQYGRHYGATGRMGGHQEVRASQIIGAQVKNSQGQDLGTINDIVVSPMSGRIDFAVLSLSSTAGAAGTSATDSTSSTTSSTSSTSSLSAAGKLVPVPWMLLRPSAGTGSSSATSATSGTSMGQFTFQFAGDTSKLQSAPSFDQSNWPDITQPSWRQSVFSHFGMTPGYSTGGATSPGGSESSTGTSGSTTTSPGTSSDSSGPSKPQ